MSCLLSSFSFFPFFFLLLFFLLFFLSFIFIYLLSPDFAALFKLPCPLLFFSRFLSFSVCVCLFCLILFFSFLRLVVSARLRRSLLLSLYYVEVFYCLLIVFIYGFFCTLRFSRFSLSFFVLLCAFSCRVIPL